jgi:predicted Zn-dependent peptidase
VHKIHQFPNGLRLIYQQYTSNVSHFGININAGTRDETSEIMGMAHFIEHMLFKGTAKRKALQIISRLEEVGGEMNAYTTKDKTTIYASFISGYLDRAVDLLTDAAFHSVFPEKEMEKEKNVILEEIDMYADNPEECINDEFQELMFKNHPLGYNILGTAETVSGLTQQQTTSFIAHNYLPQNIVYSYVGNAPFEKVIKLCEKYMPTVQNGQQPNKRQLFTNYVPFNMVKETEHAQCYCVMGNLAYSNTHELKPALSLLSNLLGGPGLNSRLNLAVRERYGYAYQIDSSYSTYDDIGYFCIYFGTDAKYIDKTNRLIDKELKRLQKEPLSEAVLHKYKRQMEGQILLAEENKASLMLALGKSLLDYNKVDTLDEVMKKVYAVTPEQILHVAREVFDEEKMSRLVYKSKAQ